MTYWEKERVRPPEDVLKEAGFNVSEKCCSRPSCFDFAARKDGTLILEIGRASCRERVFE